MSRLTRRFPLWAVLATLAALWQPGLLVPLQPAIVPLLGLVMFGMGMTLVPASFAAVLQRPLPVLLGVLLQFGVMPLAGWLLALTLGLPPGLLAGLVLLGSCPGGTASNVICYLARGDVALSITLTAVSTLLAVVATPALTLWYAGAVVPVPAADMLLSILRIIIVPVALGMLLNRYLHRQLEPLRHVFPLVSMLAIVLIIAVIVALNHGQLSALVPAVVLAVVLHNAIGLLLGYGLPRLAGRGQRECRTLAIEVGMQNSGLAVALAVKYFSATAALPAALFSIWHNLSGSLLAGYWSRRN